MCNDNTLPSDALGSYIEFFAFFLEKGSRSYVCVAKVKNITAVEHHNGFTNATAQTKF